VVNHHLPLRAGIAVLAGLALATGAAACGSDDNSGSTATAGQATQTATQTVTQAGGDDTNGQSGSTTTQTNPQKEAVVNGSTESLKSGPLTLSVKVDKVADPLQAHIDTAQDGNKLVGVFLTGKTSGKFEPIKTATTAVLKTDKGNQGIVRVIADGDCSGAFFPGGLLDEKSDQSGCVGFEIPKNATPQAITIALKYEGSKAAEGTWQLPQAK
jgi:hypothetical protein